MSTKFMASVVGLAAGSALVLATLAGCGAKPGDTAAAPSSTVTETPDPSATPTDDTDPSNPAGPPPPTKTTTKSTAAPPPSWPTPEDCVSYNPSTVAVTYDNGLYTVSDGSTVVVRVSGQQGETVGEKALALAKRFRKHCYIGRGNNREDRNAYIFDYWRNSSGMTPTIPEQDEDCTPYKRNNLTVDDMGNGDGWRVKDHDYILHVFDNERDARNGKLVLVKYNKMCSIGDSDDNAEIVSYML